MNRCKQTHNLLSILLMTLPVTCSISLGAAPRILAPELWDNFCSGYPNEETALENLGSGPLQFLTTMAEVEVMAGRDFDGTNALQAAHGALGKQIVDMIRDMLVADQLKATAMQPPSLERFDIPACLWTDLDPQFARDTASNKHGDYKFTHIELTLPTTRIAECQAWLAGHPRQEKKVFESITLAKFPGLTTREYNAAYKAAFDIKVGRPRKPATK